MLTEKTKLISSGVAKQSPVLAPEPLRRVHPRKSGTAKAVPVLALNCRNSCAPHRRNGVKIAIKIHSHPEEGEVLAVADLALIGKTLNEGKLELKISQRFYHEEIISEKELEEKLEENNNINLVGKKSFAVAQKMGLVSEKGTKHIAGIPYACIYKM